MKTILLLLLFGVFQTTAQADDDFNQYCDLQSVHRVTRGSLVLNDHVSGEVLQTCTREQCHIVAAILGKQKSWCSPSHIEAVFTIGLEANGFIYGCLLENSGYATRQTYQGVARTKTEINTDICNKLYECQTNAIPQSEQMQMINAKLTERYCQ